MAMELLARALAFARQWRFLPGGRSRSRPHQSFGTHPFTSGLYIAVVASFQHWVYTHMDEARDAETCDDVWGSLWDRNMPVVDYSGLEAPKRIRWRMQVHIYCLPFYYIEYGLAQLGAVQVWANSLQDHSLALGQYRHALTLGTTASLPEIFQAAGANFAFDAATLRDAVTLIEKTIAELGSGQLRIQTAINMGRQVSLEEAARLARNAAASGRDAGLHQRAFRSAARGSSRVSGEGAGPGRRALRLCQRRCLNPAAKGRRSATGAGGAARASAGGFRAGYSGDYFRSGTLPMTC